MQQQILADTSAGAAPVDHRLKIPTQMGPARLPLTQRYPVISLEPVAGQHVGIVRAQQLGYDVRTCNNYAGGLRCLECEDFDLVVVCQGSPKFEGRCVLKRAMEINPRMPVLVVARCLDMKCYLDAMGLGAFDYLETPLTASEAVRAMEAHLTAPAAAARARGATDYFG